MVPDHGSGNHPRSLIKDFACSYSDFFCSSEMVPISGGNEIFTNFRWDRKIVLGLSLGDFRWGNPL